MNENLSFAGDWKRSWRRRAIFIPFAIIFFVLVFGFVAMYLWNSILPGVIGVHEITFWQALGIVILSRILFGSFHSRYRSHGYMAHRNAMREKWNQLSTEQKEKIRSQCWGRGEEQTKQE